MKIPFTDMEFHMLDGFKDAMYFMSMLCMFGGIIAFVHYKNINDGFIFMSVSLISFSLSYWVPTVSLFEFWELKKQYKLKKLEEWRK